MNSKDKLNESEIAAFETRIPELAQKAVRIAYRKALENRGQVIEAVEGKLVVTSRNGSRSVLHPLERQPISVKLGERRIRRA